ncbi:MAG: hypothetical protein M1282_16415, partial [Chloroflexi bacterium]|nr:hypothetical protein [Chloroflexota bacterium]
MVDIFREHRNGFWTPARKQSLYVGLLLVVLAIFIQITAGHYSSRNAVLAPPESDLFLDNLPIVNMGFVIVGVAISFWVFSCWLLVLRPSRLLFGVKAIALFIICRAFFMNLTHEGIYPGGILPSPANTGFGFYHLLTFQGNLFFSGHTAFPFLMMLIFWDLKPWRIFFMLSTVVFGAA